MEVANYCIKKQPVSEIRLRWLISNYIGTRNTLVDSGGI